MNYLFTGRVALVTGGASGTGREAAVLFARQGAKVVVADLQREQAEATVDSIRAEGGETIEVAADMSDSAAVKAMVQDAVFAYGWLDCAFNNAGICPPRDVEWDDDAFHKTIAINVFGVMQCMKYEIPEMLKHGKGTIVTRRRSIVSSPPTHHLSPLTPPANMP
jgi:NAD(P)-dependent dehydrogenase (short-subunit alcohol dehydrogenase family)